MGQWAQKKQMFNLASFALFASFAFILCQSPPTAKADWKLSSEKKNHASEFAYAHALDSTWNLIKLKLPWA